MFRKLAPYRQVSLLVFSIIIFLNCAYYNTFYNAQKYYIAGLEKQKTSPSQAKTNFDKAVEKSAIVISKYPHSKFTPQALFIIGMSYYYLGDYTKAIPKFENLLLVFPDSKLVNEAKLYWAMSLIATEDYTTALVKLEDLQGSFAGQKSSNAIIELAQFKTAEIYLLRKDNELAVREFQIFINRYPKSEYYLKSLLMLANSYHATKNYPDAIANYQKYLEKTKPKTDNLKSDTSSERNNAVLSIAECYIESNQETQGLKIIDDIVKSDTIKSIQKLDSKSYLDLGKLFMQINDLPKARVYLKKVRDSKYLAEAFYLLGNSYETETKFDTAKVFYDSIVIKNLTSEFRALAESRITLLQLVVEKPSNKPKVNIPKPDTIKQEDQTEETKLDTLKIPEDTMQIVTELDTLNNIFNTDTIQNNIKTDTIKNKVKTDTTKKLTKTDTLKNISPIETTAVQDSAARQFHIAEIFNLNLKKYEPAIAEYEKVYTQFPKSPYAPKALFAELWVYKNILGAQADTSHYNPDFKRILNKIIIEYPNSEYANAAKDMTTEKPK
jgi:TolA-binding protein